VKRRDVCCLENASDMVCDATGLKESTQRLQKLEPTINITEADCVVTVPFEE
jgi:hypothetical protein